MSLYTQTIARATNSGRGSNIIGMDAQAEKELRAYNTQLGKDIKTAVRAFPTEFTPHAAAQLLSRSAMWGDAALTRFRGGIFERMLGQGPNIHPLELAIDRAKKLAADYKTRGDKGDVYAYKKGANREWDEVNKAYILPYIEAGGLIGERVVKDEAQRQLVTDLNPVTPSNLGKIAGITAGVVIASWFMFGRHS